MDGDDADGGTRSVRDDNRLRLVTRKRSTVDNGGGRMQPEKGEEKDGFSLLSGKQERFSAIHIPL